MKTNGPKQILNLLKHSFLQLAVLNGSRPVK